MKIGRRSVTSLSNCANGYNLDIKNPHQPDEEKEYSSRELLDMLAGSFQKSDDFLKALRKELI